MATVIGVCSIEGYLLYFMSVCLPNVNLIVTVRIITTQFICKGSLEAQPDALLKSAKDSKNSPASRFSPSKRSSCTHWT